MNSRARFSARFTAKIALLRHLPRHVRNRLLQFVAILVHQRGPPRRGLHRVVDAVLGNRASRLRVLAEELALSRPTELGNPWPLGLWQMPVLLNHDLHRPVHAPLDCLKAAILELVAALVVTARLTA